MIQRKKASYQKVEVVSFGLLDCLWKKVLVLQRARLWGTTEKYIPQKKNQFFAKNPFSASLNSKWFSMESQKS